MLAEDTVSTATNTRSFSSPVQPTKIGTLRNERDQPVTICNGLQQLAYGVNLCQKKRRILSFPYLNRDKFVGCGTRESGTTPLRMSSRYSQTLQILAHIGES